ncbi:ribokinase [Martelella alba]|uniref:Ribokinase n=1 Tax=Martelella alba TaxID=2590451 RepID=A0ABY2SHG5_9HYPH|nr:ribokinase [Martelella alba]TKI04383.1 ribokinase [Martelella alba]
MHVFVVGNIGVDQTFLIDDLPEKGASIHGCKINQDLGGKGANQAIILARCGIPTTLIAACGNDGPGDWCRRRLAEEALTLRPEQPAPYATDTSIILNSADGDNAIITTTTAAENLSFAQIKTALAPALPGDIVLQQGNLPYDVTRAVFDYAHHSGLFTVFNPSPVKAPFAQLWPLVDLVVVNSVEARMFSQMPDAASAGQQLLAAGNGAVIITLGRDGAILFNSRREEHVPAVPCRATDATGAGDTFLATMLASALRRGVPVDTLALRHAVAAAAMTISRAGTLQAFPSRRELAALLESA